MCQNETDSVGLRKWQHRHVHFHSGAVGGVDVESALWTHDEQFCTVSQACAIQSAAQPTFTLPVCCTRICVRLSLFWACWWWSQCRTGCSEVVAASAIWPLGQK